MKQRSENLMKYFFLAGLFGPVLSGALAGERSIMDYYLHIPANAAEAVSGVNGINPNKIDKLKYLTIKDEKNGYLRIENKKLSIDYTFALFRRRGFTPLIGVSYSSGLVPKLAFFETRRNIDPNRPNETYKDDEWKEITQAVFPKITPEYISERYRAKNLKNGTGTEFTLAELADPSRPAVWYELPRFGKEIVARAGYPELKNVWGQELFRLTFDDFDTKAFKIVGLPPISPGKDYLRETDYELLGVRINKMSYEDVVKLLGEPATLEKNVGMDDHDHEFVYCYKGADGTQVSFHQGFSWGYEKVTAYTLSRTTVNKTCPESGKISSTLKTPNGLSLGLKPNEIENILGKPKGTEKKAGATVWNYSFQQHRKFDATEMKEKNSKNPPGSKIRYIGEYNYLNITIAFDKAATADRLEVVFSGEPDW